MVFECFLWWMSQSDNVCTLCWELLSSDSFFSKAASEKADISTRLGECETLGEAAALRFLPDVLFTTNYPVTRKSLAIQSTCRALSFLCWNSFFCPCRRVGAAERWPPAGSGHSTAACTSFVRTFLRQLCGVHVGWECAALLQKVISLSMTRH